MLHSQFPQSSSNATAAAYFLFGLEAGLFPRDCAKEWAFSVIEAQDNPSIQIIEVATAIRCEDVFNTLAGAIAGGDNALAGRWLLAYIHDELLSNRLSVGDALRKAMQVVFSTSLPREIYYDLDILDDELQLAEGGTYGTVAEITRDTLVALASHGRSISGAT